MSVVGGTLGDMSNAQADTRPGTLRPLSADELDMLRTARLAAVAAAPYFAQALFNVRPLAAEGLGTVAVDRHWRLYIDPVTFAGWSVPEQAGALIHEAGHLLRDHAGRADTIEATRGHVNHKRFNIAGDASINDDIIGAEAVYRATVTLPEGVVTPAGLGLPDHETEEFYYDNLPDELAGSTDSDPSGEGDGEGFDGCGSGAGGTAAPGEIGGEAAPAGSGLPSGVSATDATLTRRAVAEAIRRDAASTGRGTVPGAWKRWADEVLAPPAVAWQQVFAGALRRALAAVAGAVNYTYSKPSRRRLPGVVLPAMRRPQPAAAVVVDTSGSVSDAMIAAALAEIAGVTRAAGMSRCPVYACDAAVASVSRARTGLDVDLQGGGGTDMRVGIAAALSAKPRPDVIVVMTDGYTPWPDEPIGPRLIVALLGEVPDDAVPSWATVVRVPVS